MKIMVLRKIDAGSIMLLLNQQDHDNIDALVQAKGLEMPNMKISIYKNRRGKYNHILIWCKADLGICRIEPLFATGYDYELIDLEEYRTTVV